MHGIITKYITHNVPDIIKRFTNSDKCHFKILVGCAKMTQMKNMISFLVLLRRGWLSLVMFALNDHEKKASMAKVGHVQLLNRTT